MLLMVVHHYKGTLPEKSVVWNGFSTAQKCDLAQKALDTQNLDLIKDVYALAKASVQEKPEIPDRANLHAISTQLGAFIIANDLKG